jgi:hypothetical protein
MYKKDKKDKKEKKIIGKITLNVTYILINFFLLK